MADTGEFIGPTSSNHYERMYSYTIAGFFILFELIALVCFYSTDLKIVFMTILFIIFFFYLNLYCLRIEVSGSDLIYSYGIGLFATQIPFNQIAKCDIQPNNFFRSWIYNPKGEDALILYSRTGFKLNLPSKNPKKIVEMMKSRI